MSIKDVLNKLDSIYYNTSNGTGNNFNDTNIKNEVFQGNIIISDGTWTVVAPDIPTGMNVSFPTVAEKFSIASTSTADSFPAGTGAKIALVRGLDEYYKEQQETVLLTGNVPAYTVNNYIRINKLLIILAGTTGSNEGIIYVSSESDTWNTGVPDNILYFTMGINMNAGHTAIFTVPAGDIAADVSIMNVSSDATVGKEIEIRIMAKAPPSQTFAVISVIHMANGVLDYPLKNIYSFPAKTDFYIQVIKEVGLVVKLFAQVQMSRRIN